VPVAVWDGEDLVGVYTEESTARADAAVLQRDAVHAGYAGAWTACRCRCSPSPSTPTGTRGGHHPGRPGSADTALVTRLIVVDAVLLAPEAAYTVWVSRTNRGSRINLFSGPRPVGGRVWVGAAAAGGSKPPPPDQPGPR